MSAMRWACAAPEFAMSLLDGTEVTTSSLSAEGKPVFLYFHATN